MNPYYATFRDCALAYIEKAHAATEKPGMRIGVLGGTGHGDKARQLCLCAALHEQHRDAHVFFLAMPFAAASGMVDYDMAYHAQQCGAVDDYYFMAAVEREPLIGDLRPHFDVLYDAIPYAVKAYWNLDDPEHADTLTPCRTQLQADARLAPYRWLYDGYPEHDHRLTQRGASIWDVMAQTAGVDVSPLDLSLATPVECAPWPTEAELTTVLNEETLKPDGAIGLTTIRNSAASSDENLLDLGYVGDYVVVHNSAGRQGRTKCAPPHVFKAIVSFLETEGIRAVQVGKVGDQKLHDAVIDRRGIRLPLVNRIIGADACLGFIGIDSLPMYMAFGMGKPAVILWGSTRRDNFGLPQMLNLNLVRLETDRRGGVHPPCPLGCCFRMPGYGNRCLLPDNRDGACLNIPAPEDAARAAVSFATHQRGLRDGTVKPEEAMA